MCQTGDAQPLGRGPVSYIENTLKYSYKSTSTQKQGLTMSDSYDVAQRRSGDAKVLAASNINLSC